MKLAISFLVIGCIILFNSIGATFFDIPMFYELLPIDWFGGSMIDDSYFKVVPVETESFDLRYLWLFVGIVISSIGYWLHKKAQ